VWQLTFGLRRSIILYGAVPANIVQGERLETIFSSMFLHGGFAHIIGNMIYLHVFGDNIEDRLGKLGYIVFYLFAGVVADLAHTYMSLGTGAENIPAVGASGAISGILGAYMVVYPRASVLTLIFSFFIRIVKIPALFLLGFWFILQFLYSLVDPFTGVAYWAHIGGFVGGAVVGLAVRLSQH